MLYRSGSRVGTLWAMTDPASPAAPPAPGSGNKYAYGCVGIGCGLPLLALVIFVIVGTVVPKDTGPTVGGAIAACEQIVSSQLKSPSTAHFNSAVSGDDPWTVVGSVDSENGFGAMLRSDYQCTVTGGSAALDYLG